MFVHWKCVFSLIYFSLSVLFFIAQRHISGVLCATRYTITTTTSILSVLFLSSSIL